MKEKDNFGTVFAIVSVAAFIAAIVASIVVFFEKKKVEDEELDRYLEGSIQ